ncbi:MAG: response regulator, partial [Daejeonella sp.]|uniref:response regulator n=1 Tax=Daejeonella sp. TaxID=2805397 RepID=UPI003C7810DA
MKKVLVCDDDKNARYLMTFALTGLQWEVVTSEDCNNIIEKVIEHQPSVIIMDNVIPDIGGVLTIQLLKSNPLSKDIPVILSTSDRGIIGLAEEAGADFYLPKPVDLKKLESVMNDSYRIFLSNNPD